MHVWSGIGYWFRQTSLKGHIWLNWGNLNEVWVLDEMKSYRNGKVKFMNWKYTDYKIICIVLSHAVKQHKNVCMCVYMYIYRYVCVYVYIYTYIIYLERYTLKCYSLELSVVGMWVIFKFTCLYSLTFCHIYVLLPYKMKYHLKNWCQVLL